MKNKYKLSYSKFNGKKIQKYVGITVLVFLGVSANTVVSVNAAPSNTQASQTNNNLVGGKLAYDKSNFMVSWNEAKDATHSGIVLSTFNFKGT